MKKNYYKNLIFTLLVTICSLSLFLKSNCFAFSKIGHSQDMMEIITGNKSARDPLLRSMFQELSSTIDNFELVQGLSISSGSHRCIGHWGFSSSIPFNKEPLKSILANIEKKEGLLAKQKAIQRIREAWTRDSNKLIDIVSQKTGLNRKLAKGLAGLFYDVHLLGDWSTSNTTGLPNPQIIANDIEKDLHRLFGNNSAIAKSIRNQLKQAVQTCNKNPKCQSKTMMTVLKNSEELKLKLLALFEEEYPILAKSLGVPGVWKSIFCINSLMNSYNSITVVPKNWTMC